MRSTVAVVAVAGVVETPAKTPPIVVAAVVAGRAPTTEGDCAGAASTETIQPNWTSDHLGFR